MVNLSWIQAQEVIAGRFYFVALRRPDNVRSSSVAAANICYSIDDELVRVEGDLYRRRNRGRIIALLSMRSSLRVMIAPRDQLIIRRITCAEASFLCTSPPLDHLLSATPLAALRAFLC